jgi:hypothetical protein
LPSVEIPFDGMVQYKKLPGGYALDPFDKGRYAHVRGRRDKKMDVIDVCLLLLYFESLLFGNTSEYLT